MSSKIKNIIIILVIIGVLIAAYFIFFKKAPQQANLVSSKGSLLPHQEVRRFASCSECLKDTAIDVVKSVSSSSMAA